MKTLTEINQLIAEILAIDTSDYTKRQKSSLQKRIVFLNKCRNYLESNPRKESELTRLTDKRSAILAEFKDTHPDFYPLSMKNAEYLTRQAWGMLTDQQRELADAAAQSHIDKWLYEYAKSN